MKRFIRHPLTILGAIVVLAVGGYFAWQSAAAQGKTYTAEFTRAVGVQVGSDVRVLGVKIGTITKVKPDGKVVKVSMLVDDDYAVPAGAKAVVIPPSIVADRYVQLTPAYKGGEKMADGHTIGPKDTVVPLELDEVYSDLDKFSAALGKDGSLAKALKVAKKNLKGNGKKLGDTLDNLAKVSDVLNDHSDDIWSTVDNLAKFTKTLADSDSEVRLFNQQLSDVSDQLSDERGTLSEALKKLTIALADVSDFIDHNAGAITTSVKKLKDISAVFATQQEALINILDYAPLALSNLDLVYNSSSGTLDTRDDLLGANDPASYLCAQLANVLALDKIPASCFDLADTMADSGSKVPAGLKGLVGKKSALGGT
ncbi:MAG TPA: MCE family protein [Stackebrandtia sp.]|jgi:virulence factor Mce-like protein|uniref:MCE family protein n=1 Tax=Stackebrandtia sp. TaxID=2023065 RepID=UPI002D5A0FDB|nr:MCE family protein [Stackebrandtia sp.]HZE37637.1 MCE family protein [Stackebrandtia sp.]